MNKKESNYDTTKEVDHLKKQTNINEYTEEDEQTVGDNLSKKGVSTSKYKKKDISDFTKSVSSKTIKQTGKTEKFVQTGITGSINEEKQSKIKHKTYKDEQTVTDSVDNKVLKSQISENEVNKINI